MPEGDYEKSALQRASDTTTRPDQTSENHAPSSSPPRSNGAQKAFEEFTTPERRAIKSEDRSGGRGEKTGSKRKRPGWEYVLTPASPPWKNHAADGPSAVIVDGKRKSARSAATAAPPAPPAPSTPAAKRPPKTESANGGKKVSPPWKKFVANGPTSVIEDGKRKSTRAKGPTDDQGSEARPKPGRPSLQNGVHAKKQKIAHGRKKSEGGDSNTYERRTTANIPKGRVAKTYAAAAKGHRRVNSKSNRDKTRHRSDENSDNESTQLGQRAPASHHPRIKLRFRAPLTKVPTTNPLHYPVPRKFSTFSEWCEQHDPFQIEDRTEAWTEQTVAREARSRVRLARAMEEGGPLSWENCTQREHIPWKEPQEKFGHPSFIAAHVAHFKKLLKQEHDKHVKHAKLLAVACQAAIQALEKWAFLRESKSALEIWEEQRGYQIKRYKQLVKDLEHRWLYARAEVNHVRLKKWEAEQEIAGKQALDEMLVKSQAVLKYNPFDSPLTPSEADSSLGGSSDVETGTHGSRTDAEDSGEESGSAEDSENMSDSSDQEAEDDTTIADEDENLSPDALRLKYAQALEDAESPSDDDDDDDDDEQEEEVEENNNEGEGEDEEEDGEWGGADAAQHDRNAEQESVEEDPEPLTNGTHSDHDDNDDMADAPMPNGADIQNTTVPEDYNPPELDEVDDTLLESDEDASTDMDSDMGSDDDGWGSEESGSEEGEDDLGNSMMGFFSKTQVQAMKQKHADKPDTGSSNIGSGDHDQSMEENGDNVEAMNVDESDEEVDSLPKSTINVNGMHSTQSRSVSHSTPGTPQSESFPLTPTVRPKTEIPTQLLRGTLREYQHDGLDWLAKLYAGGRNGILADEMGLGKTVQTIALLAHLAVHYEVWGPHLVVVPTSVMLNWEMEFKKFCPGFKILTYYGTQEERRQKRKGWLDDDKWNVCITSYQLILQDAAAFKKRSWHYLILDEAHNIKNFQTQRWQTLLTFKTHSRLLLTGTPLQNNLQELWSLLYFLMPAGTDGAGGFADLEKFLNSLKRPADQILDQGRQKLDAEAQARVSKLHEVLRPYLLRRLKAEVEKQMPGKYEHVVYCRLSKRQRQLYDEFMGRADTKKTLSSGNYMSIINCLMSLRKVCNHPDLFETRQIVTSFAMPKSAVADYEIKELLVRRRLQSEDVIDLNFCGLLPVASESADRVAAQSSRKLSPLKKLQAILAKQEALLKTADANITAGDVFSFNNLMSAARRKAQEDVIDQLKRSIVQVKRSAERIPIVGANWRDCINDRLNTYPKRPTQVQLRKAQYSWGEWAMMHNHTLRSMKPTLPEVAKRSEILVQKFSCVTPAIVAEDTAALTLTQRGQSLVQEAKTIEPSDPYHEARIRSSIQFPDKRLLQYDCGKLQALDKLMRELQAGGHRCLIFTQMTKVLDILEQFLNIHGHRYLRLDGATKIEQRQILTDRFNSDNRILAFILSSRSGGLGINLTGADTVIFYDLDWNPAMDAQCQDRCHRIGQTRDVHIYRFVSEYTIEANILRKSNQKRLLDDVIIQKGDFTTSTFNRITYKDAFANDNEVAGDNEAGEAMDRILGDTTGLGQEFEHAEDKEDTVAAKVAQKEMVQIDDVDFDEQQGTSADKDTAVPGAGEGKDAASSANAAVDGAQANKENLLGEDELPHVDEYMVRFLTHELRNVPVIPPGMAAAARKNKKRAKDWRRR